MKIINMLILVVVSVLLSSCQSPTLQNASRGINSSPAMWEATKDNHKVYLLGSVHILPAEVKWYTPTIRHAFESSEQVMFEVLDTPENAAEYKRYIRTHGFLPNGKMISDYLTDTEYEKYEMISSQLGLNSYYYDRMKPWLFFMALNSIITKDYSKYGVDNLLEDEAKAQNKPRYSLETIAEALNAISSVPMSKDIRELKEFLAPKGLGKSEATRRSSLLKAWATGDTVSAKRMLAKSMRGKQYYSMIIKRNNNWYPKIRQVISQKKRSMVIVGLAHLIGKGNLLDKLKRSGYRVHRVR